MSQVPTERKPALTPNMQSGKCRCCMTTGVFKKMDSTYNLAGVTQSYTDMLRDTFAITLAPVGDAQLICMLCEVRLRHALTFKRQVQKSEEHFLKLYEVEVSKESEMVPVENRTQMKHSLLSDEEDYFCDNTPKPVIPHLKPVKNIAHKTKFKEPTLRGQLTVKEEIMCIFCNKLSINKSMEAHKLICKQRIKNRLPKKCFFCPLAFNQDKTAISEHMWDVHKYKTEYNLKTTTFNCDICKKLMISLESKASHTSKVHHSCKTCSKTFRNMYERDEHSLSHEYLCTFCNESFRTEKAREHHVTQVHGLKCKQCKLRVTKSSIRKHQVEVHGAPRFKCGACDKTFLNKQVLTAHQRIVHMLQRNFSCPQCDYKAYIMSKLKRHMIKHTKERNYTCRFCEKNFPREGTLKFHERIHTGDKRQVCKFCQQAFVQRASLKYHLEKHHLNDICDK